MRTVDGEDIHATYDNVVVDKTTGTFVSLGGYHGNAGERHRGKGRKRKRKRKKE